MGHLADRILSLHGWPALAIVFLLPALEASAFIGFLFPGEIAVLLGGVLAFQGRVSLQAVILAAIAGAVIGDTIGYFVGRRWGRRMLDGTLGRFVKAHHLDRAQAYIQRRGGRAVFVGRWALRVLVPGLAGMSGVPYPTFAFFNILGGAAWATTFVVLGYLAGESWRKAEHLARNAGLVLLGLIVTLSIAVAIGRWIARHPDLVRRVSERVKAFPPIRYVRTRHQRTLSFLANRFRPSEALGLALTMELVLVGVAGWLFGEVVQRVVVTRTGIVRIDHDTWRFFLDHRTAEATSAMKAVTFFGGAGFLIPLLAVTGLLWRWRRKTWRPLVLFAGGYAGAWALSSSVKALIQRPRPAGAAIAASGWAFPSGHAVHSVVAYGMLAAVIAAGTSSWPTRVTAWTAAVLISGVIGFSRLYLGVHWLTDVLGGFALGALWLFALMAASRTLGGLPRRPPPHVSQPQPESATASAR